MTNTSILPLADLSTRQAREKEECAFPCRLKATVPCARIYGNGGGPQGRGTAQFPDISTIRFLLQSASGTPAAPAGGIGAGNGNPGGPRAGFGAGINISWFDHVKPYAVAAQALNLKCTSFVISLITPPGQSIPIVAKVQQIDPQVVSDALTKAYQTALAQDVTDNVITQAQSDQLSANLNTAVAAFVNNPTPMQARPLPAATAAPTQG